MSANLETRVNQPNQYKSSGERKIAEILTKYGIPFKYESPVLVHDAENKPRIWYPDFFLPEYGIYIEYYGLEGNPEYDSGTAKKRSAYAANGVPVVSVNGGVTNDNIERELITQVYHALEERLHRYSDRVYGRQNSSAPLLHRY